MIKNFKSFLLNKIKQSLKLDINYQLQIWKKRGLKVGKNFLIMEQCIIDPTHCFHIEIGDNVTLAPRVHILAHDTSTKLFCNLTKVSKTIIGHNVFIGASSIILPGVNIGNNVIIGAGSVVTKDVNNNSVYAGNPAKFIKTIDTQKDLILEELNNRPVFDKSYRFSDKISSKKLNLLDKALLEYSTYYIE